VLSSSVQHFCCQSLLSFFAVFFSLLLVCHCQVLMRYIPPFSLSLSLPHTQSEFLCLPFCPSFSPCLPFTFSLYRSLPPFPFSFSSSMFPSFLAHSLPTTLI